MAANDIFPSFAECSRQAREIERKLLPVKPAQISGRLHPEDAVPIFPREFEEYTATYLVSEAQKVERKIFATNYQSALSAPSSQAPSRPGADQKFAEELSQFASSSPSQGTQAIFSVPAIQNKKEAGKEGAGKQAISVTPSAQQPAPIAPPALLSLQGMPSEVRIAKETELEAEAKMAREAGHFEGGLDGKEGSSQGEPERELRTVGAAPPSSLMSSSKISPRIRAIIEEKLRKEEQSAKEEPVEIEKPSLGEAEHDAKQEAPVLSSRERLLRKLQREGQPGAQAAKTIPKKQIPSQPVKQPEEEAQQQEGPDAQEEEPQEQIVQGADEQEGQTGGPEEQGGQAGQEAAEEKLPALVTKPGAPAKGGVEKIHDPQAAPEAREELPAPRAGLGAGTLLIKPIFSGQGDKPEDKQEARDEEAEKRMDRISRIVQELSPDRYKAQAIAKNARAQPGEGEGEKAPQQNKQPMKKPSAKKAPAKPVSMAPQQEEQPEEEPQEQIVQGADEQAEGKNAPEMPEKKQVSPASAKSAATKKAPANAGQRKAAVASKKKAGPARKQQAAPQAKKQQQAEPSASQQKQANAAYGAGAKQAAVVSGSKTISGKPKPSSQALPKSPSAAKGENAPASARQQPVPARQAVRPAPALRPAAAQPRLASAAVQQRAQLQPGLAARAAPPVSRQAAAPAPSQSRIPARTSYPQPVQRQAQVQPAYRAAPQAIQRPGARPRVLPGMMQQPAQRTYLPPARRIISPQGQMQETVPEEQFGQEAARQEEQALPKRRVAYQQPEGSVVQQARPSRVLPRKPISRPQQEEAQQQEGPDAQEEEPQEQIVQGADEQEGQTGGPEEQGGQAGREESSEENPLPEEQAEQGASGESQSQDEQPVELASTKARMRASSQVPRKNALDEPMQKTPEQLEEEKRISQKAQVLTQLERQKQREISGEASLPQEEDDLEVPKPPPEDSEQAQPDYGTAKYDLRRKMQEEGIKERTKEEIEAILEGYAKENLVWLYEIYSMGGMPREDFLQKVREKMAEDKVALPAGPGGASAEPSNPALANLGKEIDKRYKK